MISLIRFMIRLQKHLVLHGRKGIKSMLRNGESKIYKGRKITKINGKCFQVGGYFYSFKSYYDAKYAIDADAAEDKALKDIDQYVKDVCGGYM